MKTPGLFTLPVTRAVPVQVSAADASFDCATRMRKTRGRKIFVVASQRRNHGGGRTIHCVAQRTLCETYEPVAEKHFYVPATAQNPENDNVLVFGRVNDDVFAHRKASHARTQIFITAASDMQMAGDQPKPPGNGATKIEGGSWGQTNAPLNLKTAVGGLRIGQPLCPEVIARKAVVTQKVICAAVGSC